MTWRRMTPADLAAVDAIAAAVHPDHPEEPAVFAERLALHPQGCHLLDGAGGPAGYVLSHPWLLGTPPALNARLGALPATPTTLYIHDLAILPQARAGGAGSAIVRRLLAAADARGWPASLVAVGGSQPFWARHGFVVSETAALRTKLASYGAGARHMVRPPARA
jgi:predicted N-acetyltransferase YhbS